ncbi:uncharacterized protein [Procambarus clarkii]|uniref:uncharacterized protein isoform X2 n=1 Tax=Procambarus clarkii TaxID=6728 RepID=UPI003742469E
MPNAEYQRRWKRITAKVKKIMESIDSDDSTSDGNEQKHECDESCDSSCELDAALSSEPDEDDENLLYYGSSPSDKSYESDTETQNGEITARLSEELTAQTCKNNSPHSSTNEMLKILRQHGFCLPEDSGAQLQSPSTVITAENGQALADDQCEISPLRKQLDNGTSEFCLHTKVKSSPVLPNPPTQTVTPAIDSYPSPSKHLPQAETIDDIVSYLEATNPVTPSSGQRQQTDSSSSVTMERQKAVVVPMPVTPGVKRSHDRESTSSTGCATPSRKDSSGKRAKLSDKANGSRQLNRPLSETFSTPVCKTENRPFKRSRDKREKSVSHNSRASHPPEHCRKLIDKPTNTKSSVVKRLSGERLSSFERKRKRLSSRATPIVENMTIEDQIKKIQRVQHKMLYMLVEIQDMLKSSGNHLEKDSLEDCRITQATTPSELAALEEDLKDLTKRQILTDKIVKIGGKNAKDHTKKALRRTLSISLMAQMNMKGKNKKIGFANTTLYSIIRGMYRFNTTLYSITRAK